MKRFRRLLEEAQPAGSAHRRWLFVPYDQLSSEMGPLSREAPESLGIVLIESHWQLARRPYHKQKLAHILANQRRFALEQAARGVAIRYLRADETYRDALRPLAKELGPLRVMEPAERELRLDLRPLVEAGSVEVIPHEGWLTSHEQFLAARRRGPPWRMDAFYRYVRRKRGVLMRDGRPEGGRFSYDPANREPWRGTPKPPEPLQFGPDPIRDEVGTLIETEFSRHPGELDLGALPTSRGEAEALWAWAKRECLPVFGPYEDAMASRSSGLFHTRLSAALNVHRLLPGRLVAEAAKLQIPLASKEGFIRQVLGWREFVRHVHLASDGFRNLPSGRQGVMKVPGDAGFRRWSGEAWPQVAAPQEMDGGARPSALGGDLPLPPAYWGRISGLGCLDRVVSDVWREGWSHHITRLVVLSGIATMLDVTPRELTDWFWVAYVDSHDWVVEPNVLGMGMFAVGDYMSTKPYVTGAAYISRMSDFCESCAFNPRSDCPITNLYWAFLRRQADRLAGNPRMTLALASARRRPPAKVGRDLSVFRLLRARLAQGEAVTPEDLAGGGGGRANRHGARGSRAG